MSVDRGGIVFLGLGSPRIPMPLILAPIESLRNNPLLDWPQRYVVYIFNVIIFHCQHIIDFYQITSSRVVIKSDNVRGEGKQREDQCLASWRPNER